MRKETTERLHTLLHNKALGFAVIFGYAAVGVLIALFAPLDILAAHPWARSFVDAVGSVIPSIEKIGQFSSLSELAQFHLAVMWVLGPVLMLYIVPGVLIQRPHELRTFFLEIRRKRLIMIFVWPVVVPAIFLALFFLSPGDHPGRQLGAYLSSRLGLSLWTLVGPLAVFTSFSFWLGSFKFWKPLFSALFLRNFMPPQNESNKSIAQGESNG